MNKKALLIYLLISITFLISPSFAFSVPENKPKQAIEDKPVSQVYSLFIPANTTCKAILSNTIDSKNAVVGQTINAVLLKDFMFENTIIASKESIIEGTITSNKTSNSKTTPSEIQIKFTTIRTPYNNIIPISASILTQDSSGILKSNESNEILIKANTPIDIIFEQPITLKAQ